MSTRFRLDTVIMVEDALKKAELAISRNELLCRLPKKVMRPTLNLILHYMEERGLITIGQKGILWTYNDNPKLEAAITKGRTLWYQQAKKELHLNIEGRK